MINWTVPSRELVGLFVEDGALALAIIAIVALAGIVAALAPSAWWLSGAILLLGSLGVLVLNVAMAKRTEGHHLCRLLRVKRRLVELNEMSAYDPKRTLNDQLLVTVVTSSICSRQHSATRQIVIAVVMGGEPTSNQSG